MQVTALSGWQACDQRQVSFNVPSSYKLPLSQKEENWALAKDLIARDVMRPFSQFVSLIPFWSSVDFCRQANISSLAEIRQVIATRFSPCWNSPCNHPLTDYLEQEEAKPQTRDAGHWGGHWRIPQRWRIEDLEDPWCLRLILITKSKVNSQLDSTGDFRSTPHEWLYLFT